MLIFGGNCIATACAADVSHDRLCTSTDVLDIFRMDGWMDGWTDGWTDGKMDGQYDSCTE